MSKALYSSTPLSQSLAFFFLFCLNAPDPPPRPLDRICSLFPPSGGLNRGPFTDSFFASYSFFSRYYIKQIPLTICLCLYLYLKHYLSHSLLLSSTQLSPCPFGLISSLFCGLRGICPSISPFSIYANLAWCFALRFCFLLNDWAGSRRAKKEKREGEPRGGDRGWIEMKREKGEKKWVNVIEKLEKGEERE